MTSVERKRRSRDSRTGSKSQRIGNHERWLVSYADLLTLLFALFVVLYAAADNDRAKAVARALAIQLGDTPTAISSEFDGGRGVLPGGTQFETTRERIEKAFASNESLKSNARVQTSERGLIISLAEAGFFAPAEAIVRDEAVGVINAIADTLLDSNSMIRVEGHTDSTPISTARYPSNWELSAARASAVLSILASRGISSSRIALSGYAGERPIADNSTADGRALNRRVDIVILRTNE